MSDTWDRSTKISSLKETVLRKLCEVLDKSSIRGWRKLGEIVNNDRRFEVRYGDVTSCHAEEKSLKVPEKLINFIPSLESISNTNRRHVCSSFLFVSPLQLRPHGDVLPAGPGGGGQPQPDAAEADGRSRLHRGSPERLPADFREYGSPAVSETTRFSALTLC